MFLASFSFSHRRVRDSRSPTMGNIGISTNPLLKMPNSFGSKYFAYPTNFTWKVTQLLAKKLRVYKYTSSNSKWRYLGQMTISRANDDILGKWHRRNIVKMSLKLRQNYVKISSKCCQNTKLSSKYRQNIVNLPHFDDIYVQMTISRANYDISCKWHRRNIVEISSKYR